MEETMEMTQEQQVQVDSADAMGELSEVEQEMCAALDGRAAFYRTLSSLYFRPLTQEQVDNMADQDFSAYADINDDFAAGVNDVTRALHKRNTGTRQDLAVDFTSAFAGTKVYLGRAAVPYKSVFTSGSGLLYQEGYHEVYKAFRDNRVKRADGLDYPDDHLSFMCEFMAVLSDRCKQSIVDGDWGEAEKDLKTSQDFLARNMVSWFDDFDDLARKLIKTRFYRGVLEMTRGFYRLDTQTLEDLLEEVKSHE